VYLTSLFAAVVAYVASDRIVVWVGMRKVVSD
jgi:hypothetical protein